eukprot:2391312-Rhodomonas_salina.2
MPVLTCAILPLVSHGMSGTDIGSRPTQSTSGPGKRCCPMHGLRRAPYQDTRYGGADQQIEATWSV